LRRRRNSFAWIGPGRSKVVKLNGRHDSTRGTAALGLRGELTVRFVSVRLPTGELEGWDFVPGGTFIRRRISGSRSLALEHETFHQMLKGRLDLGELDGQTLEPVATGRGGACWFPIWKFC